MLLDEELFDPVFNVLERCKGVEQNPKWHPEGDVFNHSLQCLYIAFRECDDLDLILATLLHDVGKIIDSKGHEIESIKLIECFSSAKTIWLVKNHMRILYFVDGNMKKLSKIKDLVNHPWLPELLHLFRIDRMGRNPNRKIKYNRDEIFEKFNKVAENHFGAPDNKNTSQ